MIAERPRARALRVLREATGGIYRTGQPLPPERELATQCGVSRTTLRWALARLAQEGLLRSAGGRTRLVADPSTQPVLAASAVYLFSSVDASRIGRTGDWGELVHLGLVQGLRSAGRTLLIPGCGIPDERAIATILRERPVGVAMPEAILSGVTDDRLAAAAEAFVGAGIPTVIFGESPSACDRVCSDHESGAYALSRWLIERGRRRQLCLWSDGRWNQSWPGRRYAGHQRALDEVGCVLSPIEWMTWNNDVGAFDALTVVVAGHLAPYLLAAEPIDAVLAMTDIQVPVICAALRRCGREPGRDIEVVGYDACWRGSPASPHQPMPPPATVDKRDFDIGLAMAALLEDRIGGRLPPAPQLRQVVPRLVAT